MWGYCWGDRAGGKGSFQVIRDKAGGPFNPRQTDQGQYALDGQERLSILPLQAPAQILKLCGGIICEREDEGHVFEASV